MDSIIKKYQQKFRKVKAELSRWDELQNRLNSQFSNAASIIQRLQVIQDLGNYGILKCVEGIEDAVLGKQMESLQTILLSMNNTLEEFRGVVSSLEKIVHDSRQLAGAGSSQSTAKQLTQRIGIKPSFEDCLDGLRLLEDMHEAEYLLKLSVVSALPALALKPSASADLGALQQLLVDQPNIHQEEGEPRADILLEPKGCGKMGDPCNQPSHEKVAMFYVSVYLLALGSGAIEPALATLGADQFDEEDAEENKSKTTFFSYYYVALNLGSLIAETILAYIQNIGEWVLAFWISTSCGFVALIFLLSGTLRYRHTRPSGNPVSRFSQVVVAFVRKLKVDLPSCGDELYGVGGINEKHDGSRRISHTYDFKYLDKAAVITPSDKILLQSKGQAPNPWHLCTVTQVEEVKCVLRLLPIWFCTIVASIVFVQVLSLFVEQGAAMNTQIFNFHIAPASMTAFDIISTSTFILCYEKVIAPLYIKITKKEPNPPSELQRIGIGMIISIIAMIFSGLVEQYRLKYASEGETSSLSIFWQIPQYVLVGVSEAFIYVAQWEFFASQIPDGLKSLGLGLSMASPALGSFLCSIIVTLVMKITSKNGKPGWIPTNLNEGHVDRFFFLSAALIALDFVLFVACANRFKFIIQEKREGVKETTALP